MNNPGNSIHLSHIGNVKGRILESVGGETQTLALEVSPVDVKLEVCSSDSSILKVSLEGNVLTLIPVETHSVTVTVTASKVGYMPATETFNVEISNYIENVSYNYKNIPIPGGGFVTGFVFHPTVPNILYCRTDIGGNYRYDFENNSWISLIDHAIDTERWETFPLSIALDKQNPSFIYSMVGEYPTHKITFSDDYGGHVTYLDLPKRDLEGNSVRVHGNAPGRSTGERLVVDSKDSSVLYMATMEDGLWKTTDRCNTWTRLNVAFPGKEAENCFAFVEIDPCDSNFIVVATNGQQGSPDNNIRGASVYVSVDAGETFNVLKGAPAPVIGGSSDHPGYVGQRAVFIDKYLYITYSAYNVGWSNWISYGCDLGMCYDGAVYRFEMDENGEVIEALDITPTNILEENYKDAGASDRRLGFGMSGISADPQKIGTLICSTITSSSDTIYRSSDYGLSWKAIMSGLSIGKLNFDVPYQKTEHSGNASCVHWMSDVKINPFDSDMALFNTGCGIFMTRDLTKADSNREVTWSTCDEGVEETVHLNIYCPPSGKVKLIDIIGDYGGFIFTDLDRPAENTIANKNKDRWITMMNADYPDSNPNLLIATPRGNWTGQTKGGLIISLDQGSNWDQLNDPTGLTKEIDDAISDLKKTNITSGWVAISADGETILWALGHTISATRLVYTKDRGGSWGKSSVYDINQNLITDTEIPIKVMADRVNSNIFYGFGKKLEGATFYISTDKGVSFNQIPSPVGFPSVTLSGIDSEMPYEIRVESGREGVIWMAMQEYGLWSITYDKNTNSLLGKQVSAKGDFIKRMGFGKSPLGSEIKMIYCSGIVKGEYGFWRSQDGGVTWKRINDDAHQYGDIRSITGDARIFGRIYVGTGTRGVLYGDIAWRKI